MCDHFGKLRWWLSSCAPTSQFNNHVISSRFPNAAHNVGQLSGMRRLAPKKYHRALNQGAKSVRTVWLGYVFPNVSAIRNPRDFQRELLSLFLSCRIQNFASDRVSLAPAHQPWRARQGWRADASEFAAFCAPCLESEGVLWSKDQHVR